MNLITRTLPLALLLCAVCVPVSATTVAEAKLLPDGTEIPLSTFTVTYKDVGFYYVQDGVGKPGIRVQLEGIDVEAGRTVMLQPYIYTNNNGERYLGGC